MNRTSQRHLGKLVAATGAAIMVLTLSVTALLATPTRGPIPPEAFPEAGGEIDRGLVPAFIPALGQTGEQVGWIAKELAVPVVDDGSRLVIPVVGDDLRTVVGHMVARHGFAPLGTDLAPLLEALPTQPVSAAASD